MHPPTFDLSLYPTMETIRLLASLLERMTAANDQINAASVAGRKGDIRRTVSASPLSSHQKPLAAVTHAYTRFHAHSIPSIDIFSYLARILKYCPCANECFLSLLVYFDRMSKQALATTGRPFAIDSYNIHRLIIAGVMVSSKFFSDVFYTNTRYAKVGGLPASELNILELEFLKLNGFNLAVSIVDLQRYGDQLVKVAHMEQEMRKTLEKVSYSPSLFRHGRSTSLGSLAYMDNLQNDAAIDRLCDLTSRVSMENIAKRPTGYNIYTLNNNSSNSSINSNNSNNNSSNNSNNNNNCVRPNMRRMTSFGNLRQSPRTYGYPSDLQHSPVGETEDNETKYWRPIPYGGHPGEWSQPSPKPTLRHPREPWQPRIPRHSQSSANMQADYWKANEPVSRRLSLTSIHAPPFVPAHSVGMPTPPPSSPGQPSYPIVYL